MHNNTIKVPDISFVYLLTKHESIHNLIVHEKINPIAAELAPLIKNWKLVLLFIFFIVGNAASMNKNPGTKIITPLMIPPMIFEITTPEYAAIFNKLPGRRLTKAYPFSTSASSISLLYSQSIIGTMTCPSPIEIAPIRKKLSAK